MKLLEKVPQDIKGARDYSPCAPGFFRWVVIGGYLSVILSALIFGLFVLREKQQNSLQAKDKQRLEEVGRQIQEIKEKEGKSQNLRARYSEWENWLKGNYSISGFLGDVYRTLPEGVRLQEFSLKEQQGRSGTFSLKMRFFSHGSQPVNTQDFEDRLTQMGVALKQNEQSVGDNGRAEMNAEITLPKNYYPLLVSLPTSSANSSAEPVVAGDNSQLKSDEVKGERK
jgi:Tfp pilus assembly protein PilN